MQPRVSKMDARGGGWFKRSAVSCCRERVSFYYDYLGGSCDRPPRTTFTSCLALAMLVGDTARPPPPQELSSASSADSAGGAGDGGGAPPWMRCSGQVHPPSKSQVARKPRRPSSSRSYCRRRSRGLSKRMKVLGFSHSRFVS